MLSAMFIRPSILALPVLWTLECGGPDNTPPPESDPNVQIDQVVAGLEHTCAVAEGRRLRCWGSGAHGKLGLGSTADIGDNELPYVAGDVELGGFGPIAQVVGHDGHTCVLSVRGKVRCWGYGPILGILASSSVGDDEPAKAAPMVDVGGVAVQLAANALRTCALLDTGRLHCWGDNSGGELGYGHMHNIGDDETPASAGPVPLGIIASGIYGGGDHFCAITSLGAVRCWGQNNNGQLGYGHTKRIGDNETPASAGDVDLAGEKVVELALGGAHTCALTEKSKVFCWGLNKYGQLGLGHNADIGDNETAAAGGPVQIDAERQVVQIAAGAVHTCALLDDGAVKCWGYGFEGQLGYGDKATLGDDETPLTIPDIELGGTAIQLSMGTHTCALLDTGRVRCWGRNGFGQLGYGHVDPVGLDDVPADAGDVVAF